MVASPASVERSVADKAWNTERQFSLSMSSIDNKIVREDAESRLSARDDKLRFEFISKLWSSDNLQLGIDSGSNSQPSFDDIEKKIKLERLQLSPWLAYRQGKLTLGSKVSLQQVNAEIDSFDLQTHKEQSNFGSLELAVNYELNNQFTLGTAYSSRIDQNTEYYEYRVAESVKFFGKGKVLPGLEAVAETQWIMNSMIDNNGRDQYALTVGSNYDFNDSLFLSSSLSYQSSGNESNAPLNPDLVETTGGKIGLGFNAENNASFQFFASYESGADKKGDRFASTRKAGAGLQTTIKL